MTWPESRPRSLRDGCEGGVGGCRPRIAQGREVATEGFQRIAFIADLCRRADAKPAKQRDGRTPSLNGVLQQKCPHERRQYVPSAVEEGPKTQTDQ